MIQGHFAHVDNINNLLKLSDNDFVHKLDDFKIDWLSVIKYFVVSTFLRVFLRSKESDFDMTPFEGVLKDFFGPHMIDLRTIRISIIGPRGINIAYRVMGRSLIRKSIKSEFNSFPDPLIRHFPYFCGSHMFLNEDFLPVQRYICGDRSKPIINNMSVLLILLVLAVIQSRQVGYYKRLGRSMTVLKKFWGVVDVGGPNIALPLQLVNLEIHSYANIKIMGPDGDFSIGQAKIQEMLESYGCGACVGPDIKVMSDTFREIFHGAKEL